MNTRRVRRIILSVLAIAGLLIAILTAATEPNIQYGTVEGETSEAMTALESLETKGRAPKTGYSRDQFGDGWGTIQGCDTRNIILSRDLDNVVYDEVCKVMSGVLDDPYTGETIPFNRQDAAAVQIDHVVALSDAWQKGAQLLSAKQRQQLANDPLDLLAVDGPANQQKGDGDAATWLPSNKAFRCEYVARQIAVKQKYHLWVTEAERNTMQQVLSRCPGQRLPVSTIAN